LYNNSFFSFACHGKQFRVKFINASGSRVPVCLAIPGKVVSLDETKQFATVDYGGGTQRQANVTLVEVRLGDYVLVHAGFAIQVIEENEAKETLKLFRQMLAFQGEG
jgi:hydrogenase expression/formation protein HypC